MFKHIHHLNDLRPFVAEKKEIRFQTLPNGRTLACYMFMDSSTFDSIEALECRGIVFDLNGEVCSRPLHKFFNLGEKETLSLEAIRARTDIVGIYEKLDGSMLATAWFDGALHWRSKKSFSSDVVKLTQAFLLEREQANIVAFATEVAKADMTAIFELTHPQARIVVAQDRPQLRLLHVRDNVTGQYVLLDPSHAVHQLIANFSIPRVPQYTGMTLDELLASLETMSNQEGYVLQFSNGDMLKIKCPWYNRLHRSITFLRERDIAMTSLNEELDDLKAVLVEAGVELKPVLEVESRLKSRLIELSEEIDSTVALGKHLDRKSFALTYKNHPLFGLMMTAYLGKELDLKDWYIKNRLKDEFGLRVLADGALADAMEG